VSEFAALYLFDATGKLLKARIDDQPEESAKIQSQHLVP
jgi:hypothetical protein